MRGAALDRELRRLRALPLNFEPADDPREPDWHVDDMRAQLPAEPPGDPLPGGTWELACALVRDYKFADPMLVPEVHWSAPRLADAELLLITRFYGLTFRLPCRVAEVVDSTSDGVRAWGFSYRTLQGHLEQGEMSFSVRKELATGRVEFRVHAYSRAAEIPNPVVRLGFRVFGRSTQLGFIRGACRRMAALTAAPDRAARRGVRSRPR